MKTKWIVSVIAACTVLASAAFSVHAIERQNIPQTAKMASYDSPELAEFAEQVAAMVNREREDNGLQHVKLSPELSEAANVRSSELKEIFSHTRPDGTSCFTVLDEFKISYTAAAENIAYGQRNPESVMNAWMNSSGHRANILNKNMDYIGVGVVYREGVYYWTQLFAASDNLSDNAYIPGEDTTKPAVTATPLTTTVQTTTTELTTTKQTTSTNVVTTEQVTSTTIKSTTSEIIQTTVTNPITTSKETESIITTQTTVCKPTVTEKPTTTCTQETTADCADIIKLIFGDCPIISNEILNKFSAEQINCNGVFPCNNMCHQNTCYIEAVKKFAEIYPDIKEAVFDKISAICCNNCKNNMK